MVRAYIVVTGRVQGVFFRAFTQEQAVFLGLFGWVRNMIDGRVEIMVEGERGIIERLIASVKRGPPLAAVESADVEWLDYVGNFDDFRITW
jgi:acylphosphatase